MTIIRQQSFLSIEELYEMKSTQKYEEIIDAIDLDAIFFEINKRSLVGALTELNYGAMIVSIFARYIERIPTIKNLFRRLNNDLSWIAELKSQKMFLLKRRTVVCSLI